MNADNFFTEAQYNEMVKHIRKEEEFDFIKASHKVNGNSYELSVYGSHYSIGDKKYYVGCWENYNYPWGDGSSSRNIGGGDCLDFAFDSFAAFKESVNNVLSKFPDYEENAQLCLWE